MNPRAYLLHPITQLYVTKAQADARRARERAEAAKRAAREQIRAIRRTALEAQNKLAQVRDAMARLTGPGAGRLPPELAAIAAVVA